MTLSNEDKQIALEQYKTYCEMKENFANRNFGTNKFYISMLVILLALIFVSKGIVFEFGITSGMILTFIGMGLSTLWWSNVDTYDTIIGIKLKDVIGVTEASMPLQLQNLEKEARTELVKDKKTFLFTDVQKVMALSIFLINMVLFLFDAVSLVIARLAS